MKQCKQSCENKFVKKYKILGCYDRLLTSRVVNYYGINADACSNKLVYSNVGSTYQK